MWIYLIVKRFKFIEFLRKETNLKFRKYIMDETEKSNVFDKRQFNLINRIC